MGAAVRVVDERVTLAGTYPMLKVARRTEWAYLVSARSANVFDAPRIRGRSLSFDKYVRLAEIGTFYKISTAHYHKCIGDKHGSVN